MLTVSVFESQRLLHSVNAHACNAIHVMRKRENMHFVHRNH